MMEREQLLAEIAASPEDDTLRLAFADWLDEQPTTKTCSACKGSGRLDADHRPGTVECRMCWGAGTIPDNRDADRAEFIRVRCEQSRILHCGETTDAEVAGGVRAGCGWCRCEKRGRELLAAHPEWSRCRCPRCNGRKGRFAKTHGGYENKWWIDCGTCDGTGDLFLRHVDDRTHATEPRIVTFDRGFPDAVTCTLAELGEVTTRHETRYSDSSFYDEVCVHCDATDAVDPTALLGPCKARFVPTPWAVEVVRQTPVVRFRMTDSVPLERLGDGNRFRWWQESPAIGRFLGLRPYILPRPLFAELKGESKDWEHLKPDDFCWEYSTAERAIDALALAAGLLVRRHAYKERT